MAKRDKGILTGDPISYQIPNPAGGVQMETFPGDFRDNLKILNKKITFLLSSELRPFPPFRDIVHFPER